MNKNNQTSSFSLSNYLPFIYFSAAAVFLFFFLQNSIPLWSSDEGRFSEVAREMFESGNFIIPHFNYVAFLDKPILAPFFTSIFYAAFGVSHLTSRLVPICSALAGLLYLYSFARRIFDSKTASYSVLLLLTTIGYVLVGRFAVIDMLMTFFLSLSLYCLFIAFWEKKPSYYLGAYTAMGLGFLTKGLIGIVLPSGIFFVFLLWTGNLKELLKMKIHWGILILAVIITPWFIAAMKKKSDFFDVFIIEQHVKRFSTGSFGRKRPFWFFVPILFGLGAPWTFFLPQAATQGLKGDPETRIKTQFLLCWLLGILIFFSIPKSKLPYYILPATVPIALLVGNFFSKLTSASSTGRAPLDPHSRLSECGSGVTRIGLILAVSAVLGAFGLNIYLLFFAHKPEILALRNFGLGVSLILAAGFTAAYLQNKSRGLRAGIFTLAAVIYAGLLLTAVGMKLISPIQSAADESAVIRSLRQPGDVVIVYASPDRFSDLPFHLKSRIAVAGSDWGTLKDQSALLPEQERNTYFYDLGRFVSDFVRKKSRFFCLLEEDRLPELEANGLRDFRILSRHSGKILLTNIPLEPRDRTA